MNHIPNNHNKQSKMGGERFVHILTLGWGAKKFCLCVFVIRGLCVNSAGGNTLSYQAGAESCYCRKCGYGGKKNWTGK